MKNGISVKEWNLISKYHYPDIAVGDCDKSQKGYHAGTHSNSNGTWCVVRGLAFKATDVLQNLIEFRKHIPNVKDCSKWENSVG